MDSVDHYLLCSLHMADCAPYARDVQEDFGETVPGKTSSSGATISIPYCWSEAELSLNGHVAPTSPHACY